MNYDSVLPDVTRLSYQCVPSSARHPEREVKVAKFQVPMEISSQVPGSRFQVIIGYRIWDI